MSSKVTVACDEVARRTVVLGDIPTHTAFLCDVNWAVEHAPTGYGPWLVYKETGNRQVVFHDGLVTPVCIGPSAAVPGYCPVDLHIVATAKGEK